MKSTAQKQVPELRKIAKKARKQGWEITRRGSGHWMWSPPQGRSLFFSSTSSDVRSIKNFQSQLKNAGLE